MQNIIAQSSDSTVIAEFTPKKKQSSSYETEGQLEKRFIELLQGNGYEYLSITKNEELLINLRQQLSKLNKVDFTDDEWKRLSNEYLIKQNDGIIEKTIKVQGEGIYPLRLDNGREVNIRILDKEIIHNNKLQVINQYESQGIYKNRYDVTILVNGLPMVHIELKRRGVHIKEAFNQINRYQRDSFWADSGLFQYVQLFVISNGTHSKYYSNTARDAHIKEKSGRNKGKKTSNSFEFTSWWTDGKNNRIPDLTDFTKTFLTRHSLLSVLTKYCVFTVDQLLLVMRPYQIAATEKIINRIEVAKNHNIQATENSGGYIWHTTGSGKTLTSFKAAQLASKIEGIKKVIFVVDRKDLDYQTMAEYDKFEKGSANSNTSTKILAEQLGDPGKKIIITTIQKMARFIEKNKCDPIFKSQVVLIFDECHRSQFGSMHTAIKKSFKNHHLFGFTGTPIFARNASSSNSSLPNTTEQAFGIKLHSYTIVDAINDENVLPFRIDYLKTVKRKDEINDKQVRSIDTDAVYRSPERIDQITDYILEQFNRKTMRETVDTVKTNKSGSNKKLTKKGFNSIFAVSDIELAKRYYQSFKSKETKLKIATIFSFNPNEAEQEFGLLTDEDLDTNSLDQPSRDFLDNAIRDYNGYFKASFDTSSEKFENYYKDISQRMKDQDIDLLIVVNMFLTGFDATTLNTLWVDKNLRYHGLLQAFSRTNRILNSVKAFGNIVSFRDLETATNEAISIFGDKEASGIVLLKSYEDYYSGWDEEGNHHKGYVELFEDLQERFPLPLTLVGELEEKEFIRLWGNITRVVNILKAFDEFDLEKEFYQRSGQDYQSEYLNLYDKLRLKAQGDKENILDDVVFEIELTKQITVNIDYILLLVAQYHQQNIKDKSILKDIDTAIDASYELRSKKELIKRFIESLEPESNVTNDWKIFTDRSKEEELLKIIEEQKLKSEETREYIKKAFQDQEISPSGTALAKVLPAISPFTADNERDKKKKSVFAILKAYFEKYLGL